MALTKITGQVINTATDVTVGVLTVTNTLSVGGTLTYEDVTNVDSVGLITARSGIVVSSGSSIGIGTDNPDTDLHVHGNLLVEDTIGNNLRVRSTVNNGNDPNIRFQKGRGGGTPAVVQNGDDIGDLSWAGYDGDEYVVGADILGEVDGTPADDDMPMRLTFKTRTAGAASAQGRLRIQADGTVLLLNDSNLQIPDKIIHDGDTNTAIRFPAADTVSFETGGVERARIASGGQLLIGDTTARGTDGGNTPQLQVVSNTSGVWARMLSATYIDSTIGGGIVLAHSRNGTVGSHTILQDDDKLGSIFFEGSDGSAFQRGAQIQAYVDGTPGTDDMPGRIQLATSADGSASPTPRLVIDSAGRLIAASGRATPRTNYKDINGDSSTPSFQFETANDDQAHSLSLTYGRNNAHGPELKLAKHRTATIGGNTIVQSGDELGCINFLGSDGTNFLPAASIRGTVNLAPGSNSMPGALRFGTTGNNAGITTDHWQINRSGILDQLHSGAMIRFLHGHTVTANDATVLNNTLDDYEEGTLDWEIHKSDYLTTGNNAGGSKVTYQKIGSMVYIEGHIRTDGTSPAGIGNKNAILTDASGNRAQLPFTPSAPGSLMVSHTRSFNNTTTATFAIGWASNNDDLYVYQNQGNHYTPTADNATLTNQTNVVITFSGHYHTND